MNCFGSIIGERQSYALNLNINLQSLLRMVECIDRVTLVGCEDTPLGSRKQIRVCPDIEHRSPWAEDPFHLSAIQTKYLNTKYM